MIEPFEIMRLAQEVTQQTEHDVFVGYYGHVHLFEISVRVGGYSKCEEPTRLSCYIFGDHSENHQKTLEKMRGRLVSLLPEDAPSQNVMDKKEVLELLGTQAEVARLIGVNKQAVFLWPDVLPPRIADRVIAACWRKGIDPSPLLEADDGVEVVQ